MGMFDYITVDKQVNCPDCGAEVDGFQSKNGPCCLETLPHTEVDNFYASCPECTEWIEFFKVEDTGIIPGYELYKSQ